MNAATTRRGFFSGAAFAALGTTLVGCASTAEASTTLSTHDHATDSATSVDVGFCRDMAFHHEQALAMCQRVLGRDTGSQVQTAAADILQNQSYERGMMHTWLQSWGESTAPPETVMAWMGDEMPADEMPGLATADQMTELAVTEGLAQGKLFLELMRTHHVGGVHMGEAAMTAASTAPVRQIASMAVAAQNYEIEIFDQLLATTYADV